MRPELHLMCMVLMRRVILSRALGRDSASPVMVLMSMWMRLMSSLKIQSSSMVLSTCIRERFQSRRELFQESEMEMVLWTFLVKREC